MPYYELLCLASGRLKRTDLASVLQKTCRAFMDNGGTVSRLVPLGADGHGPRKLAYKIRQNQVTHDSAFFVTVCAFSSPTAAKEVSRQLRIDERVLRHGIFRRPIMDSLRRIPNVNDTPPISTQADPADADYELQKFIQEFQRDFPDGFSAKELSATTTTKATGTAMDESLGVGEEVEDEGPTLEQEESVRDILAQLTSVGPTASAGNERKESSDLSWLSKIKKPDDPSRGQ